MFLTIGRRRLVRDATEPVDDADAPALGLLYNYFGTAARTDSSSKCTSFQFFLVSSFPCGMDAAHGNPGRCSCRSQHMSWSVSSSSGEHILGRCGNKRWATSSSPRTAWRGLETKYRAVQTTSLRQYHQEAARTWMGDNTGPRGGTEQDTRSLLAVLWLFRSDEYWPATGWTRHLSCLSEIPVDREKKEGYLSY